MIHTIRLLANRLAGRPTLLNIDLLGIPVRLAVSARREIRRAREIPHEAELLERMIDHLEEGDVVYDIGANIGILSLFMALHPAGRASRIHAFEPEMKNFGQLRRNVRENRLEGRLVPHRLALGSEEGTIELFVRGGPGEGRHSTVESKGSTGSIEVPVRTAHAVALDLDEPPDLVKIDVEGAEGRALAGMEPLFESGHPRDIFFELHPKGERDRMPNGDPIGTWLEARGYECAWDEERRAGRHCHYRVRSRP